MEKWKGRVALVTGAGAGIGAAISENLVKHGMKVVAAEKSEEKLQELEKKLKNEDGTFLPVKCDVTKDEDIYALFDKIKETFGGVDVCVNNVGIGGTGLNLLSETPEQWRLMANINVIALCLCSKLTVNSLKERGLDDGHIINMTSMAAHKVYPNADHFYTGTKFAVRALSEGLRQELQADNSGIKVSDVSPGLVKTELAYNVLIKRKVIEERFYDFVPHLKSEDISHLVSQILSAPPDMEFHDVIVSNRGRGTS